MLSLLNRLLHPSSLGGQHKSLWWSLRGSASEFQKNQRLRPGPPAAGAGLPVLALQLASPRASLAVGLLRWLPLPIKWTPALFYLPCACDWMPTLLCL